MSAADSFIGDGLADSPYIEMRNERDALRVQTIEECAKACEAYEVLVTGNVHAGAEVQAARGCAAAIRALHY